MAVELFDERLTTVTAHRPWPPAGPAERDRRAVVDQAAAAVMLTAWLERRRGGGAVVTGPDGAVPSPTGWTPDDAGPTSPAHRRRPRRPGPRPGSPAVRSGLVPASVARSPPWPSSWSAWSSSSGATCGCNSEADPSGPPGPQVIVTVRVGQRGRSAGLRAELPRG